MEELFKMWTGYMAATVEMIAGIIITIAALQAMLRAIVLFFKRNHNHILKRGPQIEGIRLQLGRWLSLALEFELGADILRTAIAPTWTEIGQLAAIATIRTLLNFFLQKEIDRALQMQSDYTQSPGFSTSTQTDHIKEIHNDAFTYPPRSSAH